MPLLYTLHLSRHVRGMVKGPVNSTKAVGYLFDLDKTGKEVVPDRDAVVACLPYCYRNAFANAALSQINGERGFHWTLNNSRRRYLNTLYAIPYEFDSE